MAIFRPPTDDFVRQTQHEDNRRGFILSAEQRLANRLAYHRPPTPRGRNVYLLTNGTFTENQPSDMATVSKTYHGGHDNVVTDAEAAALTSAGYGAYIS